MWRRSRRSWQNSAAGAPGRRSDRTEAARSVRSRSILLKGQHRDEGDAVEACCGVAFIDEEKKMGLLIEGQWHDRWYDTEKYGGRFERSESVFRNWVTAEGGSGFKAESGRYQL